MASPRRTDVSERVRQKILSDGLLRGAQRVVGATADVGLRRELGLHAPAMGHLRHVLSVVDAGGVGGITGTSSLTALRGTVGEVRADDHVAIRTGSDLIPRRKFE